MNKTMRMTNHTILIKSFFFMIGLILLFAYSQSVTKRMNLHFVDIAYARGSSAGCGGDDGGHGGDSGAGGGDSGDGGHGGDSGSGGGGSGGDSGDGGHSGGGSGGDDGGSGSSGSGDGGSSGGDDGDEHDMSHDMAHDTDHDDDSHDAHTTEDHSDDHQEDTVDSPHHDDDPHHNQPPSTIADPTITDQASTGDGQAFEPGILLAVNAERSDKEAAWALGLAVEQEVSLEHLGIVVTRFRLPRGTNALSSLRRLMQQKSGVPYDLNHYYQVADATEGNDARSYPRRMIGWPSLSGNPPDSAARIGMVDTFVNPGIAALKRQRIITRSFAAPGKKNAGAHGTRIASIIVGAPDSEFPGLIPAARLYAANAFSTDRAGRHHASALAIAQALDWLTGQSVDVINLSLAGPDNRLLRLAVERTLARPIPIVAAAGNQGPKAPPAFPAAYKNVIAVTAVDRFGRIYRYANQGPYISFAAPGVRIWLPGKNGKGGYCQGSSYASAYGTAMAATFWNQSDGDKRINTLVQLIRKNAIDLGTPGRDPVFGWGLIHCANPVNR